MSDQTQLQKDVDECRTLLEGKGETCPVYLSFEAETYSLTKAEMYKLANCLYLMDCTLNPTSDDD